MALPRGARAITVDGRAYRWLVSGRGLPDELTLIVQDAGGQGARLHARIACHRIVRGADSAEAQHTVVAPGFVHWAIDLARTDGWQPAVTGRDHQLRFADGYVRRLDWAREWPRVLRWDPLTELQIALTERGGAPATWAAHWGRDGDALAAAWAASRDPGVMLDILAATSRLHIIEDAFAAIAPPVAAVLAATPALRSDLDALIAAAQRSGADLHHEMIWLTDVGPSAPWATFCATVAALIRTLCPTPPTLADYLACR